MRVDRLFTSILCLLFTNVVAQQPNIALPSCAVSCLDQFPGATGPSCIRSDYTLQHPLGLCLSANCTAPETLMTLGTTAHICAWPKRDRSALLESVSLFLLIVATASFVARVSTKLPKFSGSWGIDDYVISVGWVFLVLFAILNWLCCKHGYGQDTWTIGYENLIMLNRLLRLSLVDSTLTSWLIRTGVLLLYLRLFPDPKFRLVLKVLLFAFIVPGTVFAIFFFRQLWVPDSENQNTTLVRMYWAQTYLVIPADIMVVLLPLPTIWKLKLGLDKRLGIMGMFSVGIFATVVSIYRAWLAKKVENDANYAWTWLELQVWTSAEINLGLLCACMPGVRAFFTQVYPGRRRNSASTTDRSPRQVEAAGIPHSSVGTIGSGGGLLKKIGKKLDFELSIASTTSGTQSNNSECRV